MEEINLIWVTKEGSQTEFEREFIVNRVFGSFKVSEHFKHETYDLIIPNACIIFSCALEQPDKALLDYFFRFKVSGHKFMVYHLSDEACHFNPTYYLGASAVLRSYYHKKYENYNNIYFMPLGFQSGFMNKDTKDTPKDISVFFSGSMKQDREQMAMAIEKVPDSLVKRTQYFNDPSGFKVEEMAKFYNRSLFSPCPMGWHHQDSFRLMEALECGSIPVIHRRDASLFEITFPNHPFLLIDSWDDMRRHFDSLKPFEAVCLKNTRNWYSWYKRYLKDAVKKIYETHIQN